MTATTSKFVLPYSTADDAVATVDDTLEALAERLDLLGGESGEAQITAAGAGTVTVGIVYTRDYSDTSLPMPRCWVQQVTSHADTILAVTAETRTGCTVTLRTANAGTATRTFRWFVRPIG